MRRGAKILISWSLPFFMGGAALAHFGEGEHAHPPENFEEIGEMNQVRFLMGAQRHLFAFGKEELPPLKHLLSRVIEMQKETEAWQQRVQLNYVLAFLLSREELDEEETKRVRSTLEAAAGEEDEKVRLHAVRAMEMADEKAEEMAAKKKMNGSDLALVISGIVAGFVVLSLGIFARRRKMKRPS